jgi:TolB-like protein/Tfp pilus assembly protein PilF
VSITPLFIFRFSGRRSLSKTLQFHCKFAKTDTKGTSFLSRGDTQMASGGDRVYRFGDFSLDPGGFRIQRRDEELPLRPKSFEILLHLLRHRNRVVTKRELLESVWAGSFVNETVASQCVGEIRAVLGDDIHHPQYVKTIARIGYQFVAEVTEIPALASQPSIAILAFRDMSAEKDQDHFCEGLAESIINALCHVKNLRVIARTSSFSFKKKDADIQEIGERLSVDSILEGSVRKANSRLRIAVQLINVRDGYHIWSEEFDQERGDIFSIQDKISLKVVEKLKVRLLGEEKKAVLKRQKVSVAAYSLHLKGRYLMYRESGQDLTDALQYFQRAIEMEPEYAEACASLCGCYCLLAAGDYMVGPDLARRARQAAARAIEIDPFLALAHEASACVKLLFDWDWEEAEEASRRAIQLSPGSESAHIVRGLYFFAVGKLDEATIELEKAVELDPLSNLANCYLADCLLRAGHLAEAEGRAEKALELEPINPQAHWFLGQVYVLQSRYDEGIAELQEASRLFGGNNRLLAALGWAYGVSGQTGKAQQILTDLEQMRKNKHVSPFLLAKIHAGLRNKAPTFQWLERAYEEEDVCLTLVKTDETFAQLRSDSRFTELLRKMRLTYES